MRGERVAVLADPVVRLDLRGVFVPREALRFDELPAHGRPVDLGQCGDMRVVVADRAVPLGEDFDLVEPRARAAQARDHVREFLAERGGARGLAVSAREHGERGVFVREAAQFLDDLFELARQHGAGRAQHARVGEIVDVFGSAAEMHELELGGRGAAWPELVAHEIFHRLHVVVDAALDGS